MTQQTALPRPARVLSRREQFLALMERIRVRLEAEQAAQAHAAD